MAKNVSNTIVATKQDKQFFAEIAAILHQARDTAYRAVNTAMIQTNWQIGKRIVEHEQKGKNKYKIKGFDYYDVKKGMSRKA